MPNRAKPSGRTPTPEDAEAVSLHASRHVRVLMLFLGWLFVVLAAFGALLPVLPTTPFLLLAAACFARSSPRFYRWLLSNRMFGPAIRRWRETHTVSRRVKLYAIGLLATVGGASVFFLENPWARGILAAVLIASGAWIARLPTSEDRPTGA